MKWYEDPVYIKMSEKAWEIQNLDKKELGNVYYDENDVLAIQVEPNQYIYYGKTKSLQGIFYQLHNPIWLPTQSQLQEMVLNKDYNFKRLLVEFSVYICYQESAEALDRNFSSMEQLWLAFVMKEKYNKIWDGKEWIYSKS